MRGPVVAQEISVRGPFSFLSENGLDYLTICAIMVLSWMSVPVSTPQYWLITQRGTARWPWSQGLARSEKRQLADRSAMSTLTGTTLMIEESYCENRLRSPKRCNWMSFEPSSQSP